MKSISDFIDLYSSKNTRVMYRSGLNAYMEFIYGSQRKGLKSTKEELEKFNQLSIRYMEDKRDMGDDVLKFAGHLNSRPPKSAKAIMAAVREWLLYNDIEIGSKNIRLIRKRMPKGGARTFESDLDTATLRNILMHTDLKGKAFFLILASSGMRIGELLQLTLKDVDLTKDPALIKLRQHYTKSKHARLTYISTEAREVLNEWLKVRSKYITSSANRNKGLVDAGIGTTKDLEDDRLFPFSNFVAESMWTTAVKNAGLLEVDQFTNRKTYRIHQLRKFFRSQLALGCPVDVVEGLMGHEGYLTDAYRRYTQAQMAEYYLKHESLLHIHKSEDVAKIQTEVADLTGKNQTMNAEVTGLRADVEGLNEIVELQAKRNEELKAEMAEMRKRMGEFLSIIHDD